MTDNLKKMLLSLDIEMVELASRILLNSGKIHNYYNKSFYRSTIKSNLPSTVFKKGFHAIMVTRHQVRICNIQIIYLYTNINKFKIVNL